MWPANPLTPEISGDTTSTPLETKEGADPAGPLVPPRLLAIDLPLSQTEKSMLFSHLNNLFPVTAMTMDAEVDSFTTLSNTLRRKVLSLTKFTHTPLEVVEELAIVATMNLPYITDASRAHPRVTLPTPLSRRLSTMDLLRQDLTCTKTSCLTRAEPTATSPEACLEDMPLK